MPSALAISGSAEALAGSIAFKRGATCLYIAHNVLQSPVLRAKAEERDPDLRGVE
jgi:hypothetical protein